MKGRIPLFNCIQFLAEIIVFILIGLKIHTVFQTNRSNHLFLACSAPIYKTDTLISSEIINFNEVTNVFHLRRLIKCSYFYFCRADKDRQNNQTKSYVECLVNVSISSPTLDLHTLDCIRNIFMDD